MTNNYNTAHVLTLALGLAWGGAAMAVVPPTIAQKLTDGDTYLLMNHARPAKYCTRTSWDGAYYLLDYTPWLNNTGAWQPIEFEAHDNGDGTWTFSYPEAVENPDEEASLFYLGIPAGSGNLKAIKDTDLYDTPIKWNVTAGDYEGYYKLIAGDNQPNDLVIGHPLHLNGSGEYAVIYYEGNGWGFDIYGGVQKDEDEEVVYEDDEMTFPVFSNYEHTNWAFVHKGDIEAYNAKAVAYNAIKNVEDNYAELDGFEKGFQNLIDVVSAIYDAPDGNMEDVEAIIKAKIAMYEAIENAQVTNETGDPALQAAIDKALDTFNTTSDIEAMDSAKESLNNALKVYLSGEGDFTSFGQNMSFEDLSAQGGNSTTGVANAPAGWNLYLNGKLCSTADEIKAAGVNAWCGVNTDGTGAKEQDHIFGIWNSGMPEVELSQAIDGLENGTYLVSAAVMVGANGSGSRMTTQRIFGNLNSALFGWEGDYNMEYLNPSEVYSFGELTELTTDTELQEMSVSAYVYDGTLTFGFRTDGKWQAVAGRTGTNGAGGDGWFKIDNFRIQYMGYDASDASNILEYYQDLLGEYADQTMQTAVAEKVEALLDLNPVTPEDINAAILECKDYIATVKASIDAYTAMYEYLDECMEHVDEYSSYNGIDAYEAKVMAALDAVDNGELDEAGLAELRESLEQALNELMLSGVFEGEDVTKLIANPSFENLANQGGNASDGTQPAPYGWTLTVNGTQCATVADLNAQGVQNWCAINRGDNISGFELYDEDGNLIERQPTDGDYLWGIWAPNIQDVELSQTLTGLPSGTYILTADVMVQWDWAGDNLTTQRIFANNAVCMYGKPEDYLYNATADMEAALAADRAQGFRIYADEYKEELGEEDQEGDEEESDEEEAAETRAAENEQLDDEEIDAYRMMNYANLYYGSDEPWCNTLRTLTLKFVVSEDGIAKIGFRTNGYDRTGNIGNCTGWFKVDNFTLYYDSRYIPTDVQGARTADNTSAIYTIDGIRLAAPRKGINIIRQDGKTFKVMVK